MLRRLAILVSGTLVWMLVGIGALVPAVAAASGSSSDMLALLNADRAALHLAPVQLDAAVSAIAQHRSDDMALKHYFEHTSPTGETAFTLLDASPVHWTFGGEILAWNSGYATLADSMAAANAGWLASSEHRQIIDTARFTDVGIGVATDASNGHVIWTAIFVVEPPQFSTVTVTWSAASVPVTPSRTVAYYQVERRILGAFWVVAIHRTAFRFARLSADKGHINEFRVRAVDRHGHAGAWGPARRFENT